jgi:hypothetical protein
VVSSSGPLSIFPLSVTSFCIEGLQWSGMKLGAAIALNQLARKVGRVEAAMGAKSRRDAEDDDEDEPKELEMAEAANETNGEETASLDQLLQQQFAPAHYNNRWLKLEAEMVTDLKVLKDITVLQLQKIGLTAGGAAAVKQAAQNV